MARTHRQLRLFRNKILKLRRDNSVSYIQALWLDHAGKSAYHGIPFKKGLAEPYLSVRAKLTTLESTGWRENKPFEKLFSKGTQDICEKTEKNPKEEEKMTDIIDPRIGTEYEGYILEELLGAGGMGVVYRARHKAIGNLVAIKIVTLPTFLHDKDLQARFVREAMALYKLEDVPHIARIKHVKYDPENPTDSGLIMEYIDGMPFENYISEKTAGNIFTRRQNLGVIIKTAGALKKVHKAKVIHRDLKPENVMIIEITEDGRIKLHPKLIDFGICQGEQSEREKRLTSVEKPFGSPLWSAPELFESADEVDHTVDIFSMGLMIYQIFGGEHFYGDIAYARMTGHVRMNQVVALLKDESRTEKILKNIPREAAKTVQKCIAYNPEKRIQTAEELREACIELDALLKKEEEEAIERGEQPPAPHEMLEPDLRAKPASQTAPFGSGAITARGLNAITRKSAETVTPTLPPTLVDIPEAPAPATGMEKRTSKKTLILFIGVFCSFLIAAAGIKLYIGKNGSSASTRSPRKAKVEASGAKAKAAKTRLAPKAPVLPKAPAKGQRPSNAYIAYLYKAVDVKCRKTDPRREAFERFPHYHLGCIRWYVQKLRDKNRKNFDKVALAVLILDEARAQFCFYKRQRVCGKGKQKRFSVKRKYLINECKTMAYKIGQRRTIRRRKDGSKPKRLTAMMSGPQVKKIGIWISLRRARRKQIRTAWVKSQPPERMLCFKKRK